MKTSIFFVALSILVVFIPAASQATIFIFSDEESYQTALINYGYNIFSEGFEEEAWAPTRTDGVESIVSQGLTWTSSDLIRTGSGWARSGSWGVFDSPGDPDQIRSVSTEIELFGVGGWIQGAIGAPVIDYSLNITVLLDDQFVDQFNIVAFLPHTFFGVIDTDGFNSFEFVSDVAHWGADDMTFGSMPVPEPSTLIFICVGAFLIICFHRRWRDAR